MKEFNQDQANVEGWCISECSGSMYFPEGWMDIQSLDEDTEFASDMEALAFVAKKASKESDYHMDAIRFWEKSNFALIKEAS